MARETHHPAFPAATLFDRRFEPVLAQATAEDAPTRLAVR